MKPFVVALTILALFSARSTPSFSQNQERIAVVGILVAGLNRNDPLIDALRRGLVQRGYVEGRDIRFEYREANGHLDRLPALAQELVRLRVDAIVVGIDPTIRAAKEATTQIPIVMVAYDYDPVASGLIPSLSRPGGNITGVFTRHPELNGKRLELLKELLPSAARIAVFWDVFSRHQLTELEGTARSLHVHLQPIELRDGYDYEAAFRLAKSKSDALMVLFSPIFYVNHARIAALAHDAAVPAAYQEDVFVRAGGLISYGVRPADTWGRAAYYVDRLIKGAKPGELPVEQVSEFKLVVNLSAAKSLGISVPESVLLRADEVIR